MSRGFIAALAGLSITIFAWWSPWAWPAWPSILAFDTFDHGGFAELSHTGQSIVTVLLIALNVVVWALLVRGIWSVCTRFIPSPRRAGRRCAERG